jgi:hypothetical protein
MNLKQISKDNKLTNILNFAACKQLVRKAKKNNDSCVILCPHYSINIASKYEDCEALGFDLDELSDYLGNYVEVSDYDDLVINLSVSEN